MKSPTIALDARLYDSTSTGDSTYWTCLIQALADLPTKTQFILFSNNPQPKNIPDRFNIAWEHVPGASSRWWSLVQFPAAARRSGASVVHTQYSMSPLIGRRGITTIHDVSFLLEPQWFTKKDRTLLTLGVKTAVRRARTVIAVSQTDRLEIEKALPRAKGKVTVTYNACPPWIQPVPKADAQRQVASEFGIGEPYIFTLGTRWPRKNLELAVEACRGLSERFPHRLVVAGKGQWSQAELGSRGICAGYIPQEQLSTIYSGAALYLAPSRHEGFGIPLLEAFRCGCPVVCSVGGALPEVSGGAAYVEPSWEPAAWTASIERLLADSSKLTALAEEGVRRESGFSWSQLAKKTHEVYLKGC